MKLFPIIQRLQSINPDYHVAPAFGLNAIQDMETQTPAIFVFPVEESGEKSQMDNLVVQSINARFGLQVVTANIQDNHEPLENVRDACFKSLLGWQPDDAFPIQYLKGYCQELTHSQIWWVDIFYTAYQRRQQ